MKFDAHLSIDEFFRIWLEQYKPHIRKSTRNSYVISYGFLSKEIGHLKLKDLGHEHIQMAIMELIDCGYSAGSIKQAIMILRQVIRTANENGLTNLDMDMKVKYPKTERLESVLSIAEQQQLLSIMEQFNYEYKEMIILFLLTGIRSGELRALTFSKVNFNNKTIKIDKSVTDYYENGKQIVKVGQPKTKNSIRVIPLHDMAASILLQMRKKKIDKDKRIDEEVIFSKNGHLMSTNDIRYIFTKLMKLLKSNGYCGRNINPHLLRHAFTTRCFEANINVKTISNMLGHASITTTLDIYTHPSKESLQAEILKLESGSKKGAYE